MLLWILVLVSCVYYNYVGKILFKTKGILVLARPLSLTLFRLYIDEITSFIDNLGGEGSLLAYLDTNIVVCR